MKFSSVKPNRCPACKQVQPLASATDGSGDVPGPGDIGVCHECEAVFRFTETGTELAAFEKLHPVEQAGVREARQMIRAVKSGIFD